MTDRIFGFGQFQSLVCSGRITSEGVQVCDFEAFNGDIENFTADNAVINNLTVNNPSLLLPPAPCPDILLSTGGTWEVLRNPAVTPVSVGPTIGMFPDVATALASGCSNIINIVEDTVETSGYDLTGYGNQLYLFISPGVTYTMAQTGQSVDWTGSDIVIEGASASLSTFVKTGLATTQILSDNGTNVVLRNLALTFDNGVAGNGEFMGDGISLYSSLIIENSIVILADSSAGFAFPGVASVGLTKTKAVTFFGNGSSVILSTPTRVIMHDTIATGDYAATALSIPNAFNRVEGFTTGLNVAPRIFEIGGTIRGFVNGNGSLTTNGAVLTLSDNTVANNVKVNSFGTLGADVKITGWETSIGFTIANNGVQVAQGKIIDAVSGALGIHIASGTAVKVTNVNMNPAYFTTDSPVRPHVSGIVAGAVEIGVAGQTTGGKFVNVTARDANNPNYFRVTNAARCDFTNIRANIYSTTVNGEIQIGVPGGATIAENCNFANMFAGTCLIYPGNWNDFTNVFVTAVLVMEAAFSNFTNFVSENVFPISLVVSSWVPNTCKFTNMRINILISSTITFGGSGNQYCNCEIGFGGGGGLITTIDGNNNRFTGCDITGGDVNIVGSRQKFTGGSIALGVLNVGTILGSPLSLNISFDDVDFYDTGLTSTIIVGSGIGDGAGDQTRFSSCIFNFPTLSITVNTLTENVKISDCQFRIAPLAANFPPGAAAPIHITGCKLLGATTLSNPLGTLHPASGLNSFI